MSDVASWCYTSNFLGVLTSIELSLSVTLMAIAPINWEIEATAISTEAAKAIAFILSLAALPVFLT